MECVYYNFCYFGTRNRIVWTEYEASIYQLSRKNFQIFCRLDIFSEIRFQIEIDKAEYGWGIDSYSKSSHENFCCFCSSDGIIRIETRTISTNHTLGKCQGNIWGIPGTDGDVIKWDIELFARNLPSSCVDNDFQELSTGEIRVRTVEFHIVYYATDNETKDVELCPIV